MVHTIAVIDNYEGVRNAVVRLLRSSGWRANAFTSAEEFLQGHERPTVIVAELHLPGMNGLQLLAHLQAEGRTVPLILMSAYADQQAATAAMAAGATAFLAKPFEAAVLVDEVRKALGSRG
jgi:FixJ family two-component response regulator